MDVTKILKTTVKNLKELKDYNFDDRYVVNNIGEIYRVKEIDKNFYICVPMSPFITKVGYVEYVLTTKDGSKKHVLIHRIVAMLFLPKPKSDKHIEVNHKDLDKTNNKHTNLVWVTKSENIIHMHSMYKKKRG